MHIESGGHLGFAGIEELAKFQRAMAAVELRDELAGFQFQGGEQRSGAMAFVVVGAALRLPWP
jgi:hypothetical protein